MAAFSGLAVMRGNEEIRKSATVLWFTLNPADRFNKIVWNTVKFDASNVVWTTLTLLY